RYTIREDLVILAFRNNSKPKQSHPKIRPSEPSQPFPVHYSLSTESSEISPHEPIRIKKLRYPFPALKRYNTHREKEEKKKRTPCHAWELAHCDKARLQQNNRLNLLQLKS